MPHINVQPFKKIAIVWYSSIDLVFLLLLCILYTSVVGTVIGSMFGNERNERNPEEYYDMQIANSVVTFLNVQIGLMIMMFIQCQI